MNIHFYLNDKEETKVTSIYEIESNPFSIGDILHLDVENLYPADYNKLEESFGKRLLQDNKELEDRFNRKKIKIVKEGRYLRFKIIDETKLVIEYHCEIVD